MLIGSSNCSSLPSWASVASSSAVGAVSKASVAKRKTLSSHRMTFCNKIAKRIARVQPEKGTQGQNTAAARPCTVNTNTHHECRPFHTIHRALQFPVPRRKQVIPNLVITCMAQRHDISWSHTRNASSTSRGSMNHQLHTHIRTQKTTETFPNGPNRK